MISGVNVGDTRGMRLMVPVRRDIFFIFTILSCVGTGKV